MVGRFSPSKLLSSAISLITLSRPAARSHYPAAVTTIIIFLLAQPRTVMAGRERTSALGKINAFYRVSGISSCFIRFCAQTRFTPAIILNCFQSFEAIRNRREVEYTRIILKSLIDFDLEIIGWKII